MAGLVVLLLFLWPHVTDAPEPEQEPDASDAAGVAASQPAPEIAGESEEEAPPGLFERDYLTANWGGWRDRLEESGLTVNLDWIGLGFVNTHGGLNTAKATEYTNCTRLSLTFNTQTAKLWPGGEFYVLGEDVHGRGISEHDVGDLLGANVLEAPAFTQVSEYWWRQSLLDEKVWFKLGKIDALADVAFVQYGLEFLNSAMAYNALVPAPTYPDPALGAEVGLEPTDWVYFIAGVFDQRGKGTSWGFDTAFHAPAESVTITELGFKPTFAMGGRKLPGIYRVGGWYSSGPEDVFFNDLDGRLAPRTRRGNSGVYLGFDQLLIKECDAENDEQGLGAFLQFGWAPPEYNEISQSWAGGLQWTGLIPTRDADVLGAGAAYGGLSGKVQHLEQRYGETAIEVSYKIYVAPWLSVQPDLQYIVDPAGAGRDAFLAALRVQISF